MDTLLHGKIGLILGRELIERGYSNINTEFFVYGNVLPDLNLKYRMTKHSKNEDWNRVLTIMDDVAYNKEKTNKDVSVKLGMLSHYLCDFFTFPHNDAFHKSIIHHELYEQAQRILWWGKLSAIWNECKEEIEVELKSTKDIISYIEDMHCIYIRNLGDKKRDIFFSNILIRVVCASILKIRETQKSLELSKISNEEAEICIV
ncbi:MULTISPECIES: zinc dependent phospholipase C family protein [unclassified Clostridium]|uniref:zinc dependent phospholipase C family protein n=1 Tax=unclassified Clostridium TaxID=2614128 RepID=UPI0002985907|nr:MULTISPECIES: zinc dependent phospholipase C family protein [unclassified Clostridium]EKQ55104.1 MAG: hypothetical protein A370_02878 [Clostridium sp. Maddingley MBC34-26]